MRSRAAFFVAVLVAAAGSATIAHAVAPANDNFADAQVVPAIGGSFSADNDEATDETAAGEPDHAASGFGAAHSVWYSWTPSASGPAQITTCGSSFDTRLGVYTGDAVSALTEVAANENSSSNACGSEAKWAVVDLSVTAGTTYRIAVDTSGALDGSMSSPARGPLNLTVTGPGGSDQPPAEDDTNPGTAVSDQPFSFKMDRFIPTCEGLKSKADECSEKAERFRFKALPKLRRFVERQQKRGADLILRENAKPSNAYSHNLHDTLLERGKGGEILSQNVAPNEKVTTTATEPQIIKVSYFEPAEDKKIQDEILKALEKASPPKKKEPKSKCEFIATGAPNQQILGKLGELTGSGLLTQSRAGEILAKFGCGYEVREYFDAPGARTDFVDDVVGVDKKNDLILLRVALPVAQDFVFVIREDPTFAFSDTVSIGIDGALTKGRQPNEMRIQVLERSTGRLAPGVDVTFYNRDGELESRKTDRFGEVPFASLIEKAGEFTILAKYEKGGAVMTGFRSIEVKDRKRESFTTMAGRVLFHDQGDYIGVQSDVDRAKALGVVPAHFGTGLIRQPASAPTIEQGPVLAVTDSGLLAGSANVVSVPDDSNFIVGAAPGLVAFGGGLDVTSAAQPGSFKLISDFLYGILSGLKRSFDSGEGSAADVVPADQRALIAQAVAQLEAFFAPPPQPPAPPTDQKIGITAANHIAPANGPVVPLSGLLPRDANGNLIGQAGGNLIGQAGGNLIGQAGGNLIGQAGGNAMPVPGGNIISDNGAS